MRCAWISGWGLPAAYLEGHARTLWPEATHAVFTPTPSGLAAFAASPAPDLLIGYSLGTLLILRQQVALPPACPVALLAPILDLKTEAALGGRVSTTKIKYLLRWLRRDPLAALADFYAQAGLALEPPGALPYELDGLAWGLEALLGPPASPVAAPVTARWIAGDADPLVDTAALRRIVPGLDIVIRAGHDPARLIQALSR